MGLWVENDGVARWPWTARGGNSWHRLLGMKWAIFLKFNAEDSEQDARTLQLNEKIERWCWN
jgi:hypothetical protein